MRILHTTRLNRPKRLRKEILAEEGQEVGDRKVGDRVVGDREVGDQVVVDREAVDQGVVEHEEHEE